MKNNSFTLIELLVVIAIIGILAGILIVSMISATNSSNDARRKADIHAIVNSIQMYNASNGSYPVSSSACNIGSNCSSSVNTALGDSVNARDPKAGTYYTYWSDGTDFVVSASMSDASTYGYISSVGYSDNAVAPSCGAANKTYYATASSYGSDAFCAVGTINSTPAFPGVGETKTWTCTNIGMTSNCSSTKIASPCSDDSGIDCYEPAQVGNDIINIYTLTGASTSSATWVAPTGVTSVRVLVVAGGGGGAGSYYGGGGGAGGVIYHASKSVTSCTVSTPCTITVGAGGAGGGAYGAGGDGSGSQFYDIIATGGGGGGCYNGPLNGRPGGSGGGGGSFNYGQGGAATPGSNLGGGTAYGNKGGDLTNPHYSHSGSGGGGAGAVGACVEGNVNGNAGGAGMTFDITGTTLPYAGGGCGGAYYSHANTASESSGIGGVGAGTNRAATAGTANTGSGGGGGYHSSGSTAGGAGGSGTVIIRFTLP